MCSFPVYINHKSKIFTVKQEKEVVIHILRMHLNINVFQKSFTVIKFCTVLKYFLVIQIFLTDCIYLHQIIHHASFPILTDMKIS